jgi:hypothetical protein
MIKRSFINQKCQIQCDWQSNLCTKGCAVYGTFDTFQYNINGVNFFDFILVSLREYLYYLLIILVPIPM